MKSSKHLLADYFPLLTLAMSFSLCSTLYFCPTHYFISESLSFPLFYKLFKISLNSSSCSFSFCRSLSYSTYFSLSYLFSSFLLIWGYYGNGFIWVFFLLFILLFSSPKMSFPYRNLLLLCFGGDGTSTLNKLSSFKFAEGGIINSYFGAEVWLFLMLWILFTLD